MQLVLQWEYSGEDIYVNSLCISISTAETSSVMVPPLLFAAIPGHPSLMALFAAAVWDPCLGSCREGIKDVCGFNSNQIILPLLILLGL